MSPAPKSFHQEIIQNLLLIIGTFVRQKKLGKILPSPVDVKFSESESYQPDIVFISRENLSIIKDWGIDGTPDMVVEVLSASTAYYDLTHKKTVYEDFGVKEYLIVDPMERTAELFVLQSGKGYVSEGLLRNTGNIFLQTLSDLNITLEEIFDTGL